MKEAIKGTKNDLGSTLQAQIDPTGLLRKSLVVLT
jgi:hypothetical protein